MVRKPYILAETILSELREYLQKNMKLDYITFSGSGEPTLNSEIGKIITGIKKMTSIPVCVLTNSMLLHRKDVCNDIKNADLIIPSLDAASDKMFRAIDRPPLRIKIENIITALENFRKVYSGQIWLEILFVDGYNTKDEEVILLKTAIDRIKPDRIQLNTVDRPPLYSWVKPASYETLDRIKTMIGFSKTDITIRQKKISDPINNDSSNPENSILELLKRRQSTANDISQMLSMQEDDVTKFINNLESKNLICRIKKDRLLFYALKNRNPA